MCRILSQTYTVENIRKQFANAYHHNEFNQANLLEILNACFSATEPTIFGEVNYSFADREREWYMTMSRNIHNMKAPPAQWLNVAGWGGETNSNYGWCIFSKENYYQYKHAIQQLERDASTKRACMIYQRPSMQREYNEYGKDDFICTWSAQMFIRSNKLIYCVNMRSNDVIWGYKNDCFWHSLVYERAYLELQATYPNLGRYPLQWFANTLHIYPRHHHYVKSYIEEVGLDYITEFEPTKET